MRRESPIASPMWTPCPCLPSTHGSSGRPRPRSAVLLLGAFVFRMPGLVSVSRSWSPPARCSAPRGNLFHAAYRGRRRAAAQAADGRPSRLSDVRALDVLAAALLGVASLAFAGRHRPDRLVLRPRRGRGRGRRGDHGRRRRRRALARAAPRAELSRRVSARPTTAAPSTAPSSTIQPSVAAAVAPSTAPVAEHGEPEEHAVAHDRRRADGPVDAPPPKHGHGTRRACAQTSTRGEARAARPRRATPGSALHDATSRPTANPISIAGSRSQRSARRARSPNMSSICAAHARSRLPQLRSGRDEEHDREHDRARRARARSTPNGLSSRTGRTRRGRRAAACPRLVAELEDAADDDHVVAGVVLGDRLAVDERERVVEDRRTAHDRAGTSMCANRSAPFCANRRQTSSPSSSRMFAAHLPAAWMRGHVVDDFAAQNSTSGGSSDTDVNELHAMPTGSSPSHRGDDGDAGREVAEHRPASWRASGESDAVRRARRGSTRRRPGRRGASSSPS